MKTRGRSIAIPALVLGLIFHASCLAAVRFIGLGDLPGGEIYSYPEGVSDDGTVVVGVSNSSLGSEGFRWTRKGGIQRLSGLPANSIVITARDVSADGQYVVATLNTAGVLTAIRWSLANGVQNLGNLPGASYPPNPQAVCADGSVVVGTASSTNGSEPFRWTPQGGMIGLNDLTAGSSSDGGAYGVSDDGSVVVGQALSPSGYEGFVWTAAGGMKGLGDLPDGIFFSYARAISPDGTAIVGNSNSADGNEAFQWTLGGGISKLGWPAGLSIAFGVSNRAEIIVGGSNVSAVQQALMHDASGNRTIKDYALALGANVTGWTLLVASDVSPNGRHIIGSGTNPTGGNEGWILSILPDPPTIKLTGKSKVRAKANGKFKIRGIADDDADVVKVEYQTGGKGAWKKARGTERWRISSKLKSAKATKISVRSVDEDGQQSTPVAKAKIVP